MGCMLCWEWGREGGREGRRVGVVGGRDKCQDEMKRNVAKASFFSLPAHVCWCVKAAYSSIY